MFFTKKKDKYTEKYLGYLSDVVITHPYSFTAERLGGADFDGDMVKTIADPILNKCVNRNYAYLNKPFSMTAREAVSAKCREIIKDFTAPGYAVRYFAALGKRKQMFDILPDRIEENLIRRRVSDA